VKARRVDPAGSIGASVGPHQVEVVVDFALSPASRCRRAAILDTDVGPTRPRGFSGPASPGKPRSTIMHRHSPGRGSSTLMRGRKSRSPGDARSLCVKDGGSHGRLHGLFDGCVPTQPRMSGSGPKGRQCLDRLPATARPAFFPCRQGAAFLAGQKSRLPPSSAVLRARRLRADRSPGQGPPSRLRRSQPDNRGTP
jgi:hypothetical protein